MLHLSYKISCDIIMLLIYIEMQTFMYLLNIQSFMYRYAIICKKNSMLNVTNVANIKASDNIKMSINVVLLILL